MSSKNSKFLSICNKTIDLEIEGLNALKTELNSELGNSVAKTIQLITEIKGRVIVTGLGKSGHVAKKIAATLASTGTPALFVHAGEAGHGDLGMITQEDVIIALSWSGETSELAPIIAYASRFKVPLIAMTSGSSSTLAAAANIVLLLPNVKEACPNNLAPTTSALLQMSLGDILAMTLLDIRGFSPVDYKVFHPGGRLGANLKQVREIMHVGNSMPLSKLGTLVKDAIVQISEKGFGCIGVVNEGGKLIGIITDGDLRRHLTADILHNPVESIMSDSPITVQPEMLVGAALELLNSSGITALYVVENEKPIGIVHLHDLLRVGAI